MTADATRLGCQPMLASMLGNFECAGCSGEGSIGPPNGKLSRSKNGELSRAKNEILDALTIAYRTSYFVHREISTARTYKRHGAERPSISSPLWHFVLLCVCAQSRRVFGQGAVIAADKVDQYRTKEPGIRLAVHVTQFRRQRQRLGGDLL